MKKTRFHMIAASACMIGAATAATNYVSGTSTLTSSWDNGLPTTGNDGFITVDFTGPGGPQNTATYAGATITASNAAVLTFGADVPAGSTNWIFNSSTVNATDDIFTNNSVLTFNVGSFGNAGDDFEAQGVGGSLVINGGTHTSVDYFGFQGGTNTSTLNFIGGSVTAARLRLDSNTTGSASGVIGGTATFVGTGTTATADIDGIVNILSNWTGSLTANNFAGTTWQDVATAGWTLDNVAINETVFTNNFVISNDGKTLSVIPEPSSAMLLGALGLLALRRRRN